MTDFGDAAESACEEVLRGLQTHEQDANLLSLIASLQDDASEVLFDGL